VLGFGAWDFFGAWDLVIGDFRIAVHHEIKLPPANLLRLRKSSPAVSQTGKRLRRKESNGANEAAF
jgi:hypothetical protein